VIVQQHFTDVSSFGSDVYLQLITFQGDKLRLAFQLRCHGAKRIDQRRISGDSWFCGCWTLATFCGTARSFHRLNFGDTVLLTLKCCLLLWRWRSVPIIPYQDEENEGKANDCITIHE